MLSTATPTSNTSPLSLHDALPISHIVSSVRPLKKTSSSTFRTSWTSEMFVAEDRPTIVPRIGQPPFTRSEEHTSELQSLTNLVCRLLLEKNNPDCFVVMPLDMALQ